MLDQTIASSALPLDPSDLLSSGGEGAVYRHHGQALKLFHRPAPQRTAKLITFQQSDLQQRLPANVLSPQELLVGQGGEVIGYLMPLLPAAAHSFKKLAQLGFCQQHGLSLNQELGLLIALRRDLHAIHNQGVVVGDLNEHNLYFELAPQVAPQAGARCSEPSTYWIDVDSFQFAGFPCPVALQQFLDPLLYGVADFSAKAVFSRESDWYAFAVLLCRVLLKTHPYGGTHHALKTIQARASAGVSVFHPEVAYPKAARRPHVLDEQLIAYLHRVFEEGHRSPPPERLLPDLQRGLRCCAACGQYYAASRQDCPDCYRQAPLLPISRQPTRVHSSLLLQTVQLIVHHQTLPDGCIYLITRHDNQYHLLQVTEQGIQRQLPLFSGAPGARFAFFQDALVVNPAGRRELLIIRLHLAAGRLSFLETTTSDRFENDAVFAATPLALYRLAGGHILRGEIRHGRYLEEMIATAHRRQTKVWGSPHADWLVAYHRILGQHEFSLINPQAQQRPITPATAPSLPLRRLTDVNILWHHQHIALLWHEKAPRSLMHHSQLVTLRGQTIHQAVTPATAPPFDRLDAGALLNTSLFLPTDEGILKIQPAAHSLLQGTAPFSSSNATLLPCPGGLLVRHAHTLHLLKSA